MSTAVIESPQRAVVVLDLGTRVQIRFASGNTAMARKLRMTERYDSGVQGIATIHDIIGRQTWIFNADKGHA